MAYQRATLKQADLARYAKALRGAGIADFRVIVHPDGKHEIVAGKADSAVMGPDPDELLE